MKIILRFVISTLFIILIGQFGKSCSCIGVPCHFFACDFEDRHLVHVKVIGQTMLKGENFYARLNRDLTVLKVVHTYSNQVIADTIKLYQGRGATCFRGLPDYTIGSEYILKLTLLDDVFLGATDISLPDNLYWMSLCDRTLLEVMGKKVRGHISKNKICSKRARKVEALLAATDSEGLIDFDQLPKGKSRKQKMSLRKFGRKWKGMVQSKKSK